CNPICTLPLPDLQDRLPDEPRIAERIISGERLGPGISPPLPALPPGAVCIRVFHALFDRIPAQLPDLIQRGIRALEAAAVLDRIGGVVLLESVDCEFAAVRRPGIDLDIAEG